VGGPGRGTGATCWRAELVTARFAPAAISTPSTVPAAHPIRQAAKWLAPEVTPGLAPGPCPAIASVPCCFGHALRSRSGFCNRTFWQANRCEKVVRGAGPPLRALQSRRPAPAEASARGPTPVQGTRSSPAVAWTCVVWALKCWSERRDSNSRPLAPEASALPGCATLRPTCRRHPATCPARMRAL
jgi:hypothetical protein